MQPSTPRRIGLALAGVLILSHCAQEPVNGGKDFVRGSDRQEIQRTAQARKELLAKFGVVDNRAVQTYVTRVGKTLAVRSRQPDLDWHFTVLDSPEVNAFALPGGYVYITRGILAYLVTEAELAGLLAHEIGHVTSRHSVRPQAAATTTGLGANLGPILLPGLNGAPGAAALQSLAISWSAGYGREQELEANRLGAECLAKAGYNPVIMAELIGVLNNLELFDAEQTRREGRALRHQHDRFATHPEDDRRLRQVVGEANKYKVASSRAGSDQFMRAMNGVYFGASPDQGVIRHNALLHERFGIALQFPRDWLVEKDADLVSAVSPQGDALMEFAPGPKDKRTMDTLQQGFNLDPGARYESGTVSGLPAAFAAGAQQGKPLLVAAISVNGSQFLVAGMTKDGPAYQRNKEAIKAAISSFHPIDAAERQAARPYVISVIEAQFGTTMAALAAHSPLGPQAERYLRLMNRLYPSGEPRPGQLLKVVN
jgi:predicted Zn-dependent protease